VLDERIIDRLHYEAGQNVPLNAGAKTGFLRHLYIKMMILPRQARDKHRETTQKRDRFGAAQCEDHLDLTERQRQLLPR
jgi:hypothetical protein